MDQDGTKLVLPGQELLEVTVDPSISMSAIAEEVPAMTVATLIGVTVLVLMAIVAVFVLGILIDCRQQRILNKKMGDVKRLKYQRRMNIHPEADVASIAQHMEEPGTSIPPAQMLQNIP